MKKREETPTQPSKQPAERIGLDNHDKWTDSEQPQVPQQEPPTSLPNPGLALPSSVSNCWCGGGTPWRWMNVNPYDVAKDFCPCPRGVLSEGIDKEQELLKAWRNAVIPARFQDCTLESSPIAFTEQMPWDRRGINRGLESFFFHGPVGVGKTGLAVGYARAVLESNVQTSIKFITVPRLLGRLRASYSDDSVTEAQVIQEYLDCDLLILDDLGAEQVKGTGWVEDRLYQVIGERHDELKATVFTSNLSIVELAERIGERISWRIAESCEGNIIKIDGPNLRAGT